jgi:superoxide dismutase
MATSINIPWYLANATLWRLAARQGRTAYTPAQVAKVLRHEVGHAVGYAFQLYQRPDWRALFGDFTTPYRDEFRSVPRSTDFVEYLDTVSAHYPQKHPDEDWAEAFAAWLDPTSNWATEYASWPGALDKLRFVEFLWESGAMSGPAPNLRPGRVEPYTMVRGTVGELLGAAEGTQPFRGLRGWSEHAELLRSEAEPYNGVVLHEAMWDVMGHHGQAVSGLMSGRFGAVTPNDRVDLDPGMGGIGGKFGTLLAHVTARWGGWEAYVRELRAILGATSGWALTVWDPRRRQLANALVEGHAQGVPAGCRLVLALDAHEHAYAVDYAGRKDVGMAALLRNVDWGLVEARILEPAPVALALEATLTTARVDLQAVAVPAG